MAGKDAVQILFGPGRTVKAQFLPVHPVIHHVIQGVNRGVAGESGEQSQAQDFRGRKGPQP